MGGQWWGSKDCYRGWKGEHVLPHRGIAHSIYIPRRGVCRVRRLAGHSGLGAFNVQIDRPQPWRLVVGSGFCGAGDGVRVSYRLLLVA